MAGGKMYKYVPKKKAKKRGKRARQPTTLVLKGPTLIPDQMFCKLRYRATINLSDANGIFAVHNFRANSIFDPDQSGIGGQPLGRDQWNDFYQRYQVMASGITVKFIQDQNHGANSNLCVAASDGVGVILNTLEAQEQPYAKGRVLALTSTKPVTIKNYLTTKRKFGYKDITQEDNLQATMGNNPSEQWYWVVNAGNMTTPTQLSIDANVEVVYYVRMFDRKDLSRS